MSDPNTLFDRKTLSRNRDRARRGQTALFLHQEAIVEIQERLNLVKKSFTSPACVTAWPEVWAGLLPNCKTVPDDDVIELEEGAHDLVIHAMSLHWSNDPVGQLIQCRRALKPDGLFLAVLFGGHTLHELRAVLAETETKFTGGLSARIAPMAEIRDLGGLMQRAGFALPVADSQKLSVNYASMTSLIRDLRAMGETNALTGRPKKFTSRTLMTKASELYHRAFSAKQGRILATFELIYLAGWAPDASQPKALRPGSAVARLADVLGTAEIKLDPQD